MNATSRPIDPEELLAHADWVRALARRLAIDDAQGDDVAQEALVVALDRAAPTRLGPWLTGVVRNLAWKSRRSHARRARYESAVPAPPQPSSPEELAERAEAFRDVAAAVAALEPVYRDVVVLRFFDGLATRDIAARLGVPVETVRTRLKRALALLRGRLDQRHGGRAAWVALLAGPATDQGNGRPTLVASSSGAISVTKFATAVLVMAVLAGAAWLVTSQHRDDDPRIAAAGPPAAPPGMSGTSHTAASRTPRRGGRAVAETPASDNEPGPAAPQTAPALADADAIVILVIDERGAPVAGVPVGITDRQEWARTDDRGVWRTRRPDGEATVYANCESAVGGRWYLDARTTVAPRAAEARLSLTDAVLAEGRVVGPDGTPLPLLEMEVLVDGVRACKCNSEDEGVFAARLPSRGRAAVLALTGVRYVRSGPLSNSTAVTTPDPSGRPLPGAGEGRAGGDVIRSQAAYSSPWDGRLDNPRTGAAPLVLVARPMERDGELDVRIVDASGDPVAGVRVAACSAGMWIRSTADPRTDAAGCVHLTGLDRRGVRVDPWTDPTASPRDTLPPLAVTVVPRGQEVTLPFRPALAVAGMVVSGDGHPAGGVCVRVFAPGVAPGASPRAESDTAEDGAFRLLVPVDAPRDLRVEARIDPAAGAAGVPLFAQTEKIAPGTTGLRLELRAR